MTFGLIVAFAASLTAQQQFETNMADLNTKLMAGRFDTKMQGGKLIECKVTQSTGDAELDTSFCDSARACPVPGDGEDAKAASACMNEEQTKALARLAATRAGLQIPESLKARNAAN